MKQGGAETDKYQDKGNDDEAFDNHDKVMVGDKAVSILV